jgi:hypothetical protein
MLSAHCGEHWPRSDMLVLEGEQGVAVQRGFASRMRARGPIPTDACRASGPPHRHRGSCPRPPRAGPRSCRRSPSGRTSQRHARQGRRGGTEEELERSRYEIRSGSKATSTASAWPRLFSSGGLSFSPTGPSDAGGDHSIAISQQLLHGPEAASGEDRGLDVVAPFRVLPSEVC